MPSAPPGLDAAQAELLGRWLPAYEVVDDMSWGVLETTVLRVETPGGPRVVKAGGPADHHLAREIRAHREWTGPWVAGGRAARLIEADAEAKLLLTEYLPGRLVQDDPAAADPATYEQAGALLAAFHAQTSVVDDTFERRANAKSLSWLEGPHRIVPDDVARLRALIAGWPEPPAVCVPTHGDWQPRNWLIDDGTLRVIDFGRADLRPPLEDFERLDSGEFVGRPDLAAAFTSGYGSDPRRSPAWQRQRTRAGISAACWSFRFGVRELEQRGLRMIAEVLAGA